MPSPDKATRAKQARERRARNPEMYRGHVRVYYSKNRDEILVRKRLRRKARSMGLPADAFLSPLKRTGPRAAGRRRQAARRAYRENQDAERGRSRTYYDENRADVLLRRKAARCGVTLPAEVRA